MADQVRVLVLEFEPDSGDRHSVTRRSYVFGVEIYGKVTSERKHPGPGHWIRWGSFSANFWFTSGSGRSWKEAAEFAKRRLHHLAGAPHSIAIKLDERSH